MREIDFSGEPIPDPNPQIEEIKVICPCGRISIFGINLSNIPAQICCSNPECSVVFTKAQLGYDD